jgi:hypothetical protein
MKVPNSYLLKKETQIENTFAIIGYRNLYKNHKWIDTNLFPFLIIECMSYALF